VEAGGRESVFLFSSAFQTHAHLRAGQTLWDGDSQSIISEWGDPWEVPEAGEGGLSLSLSSGVHNLQTSAIGKRLREGKEYSI
jgi:hypothetical protein